jgi:hypothetical protein
LSHFAAARYWDQFRSPDSAKRQIGCDPIAAANRNLFANANKYTEL